MIPPGICSIYTEHLILCILLQKPMVHNFSDVAIANAIADCEQSKSTIQQGTKYEFEINKISCLRTVSVK